MRKARSPEISEMLEHYRSAAERHAPEQHPATVAWSDWLTTDEGRQCMNGSSHGPYLENRLWRAFMAGYDAKAKELK